MRGIEVESSLARGTATHLLLESRCMRPKLLDELLKLGCFSAPAQASFVFTLSAGDQKRIFAVAGIKRKFYHTMVPYCIIKNMLLALTLLAWLLAAEVCALAHSPKQRVHLPRSLGSIRSKFQLKLSDNSEAINVGIDEDSALIARIEAEVMAESGVGLDQLINPSKVVNLERDLLKLRYELEQATSNSNTDEVKKVQDTIDKKQATLRVEKRAVMRGWLKNLFVIQSIIAGVISYGMVYNIVPGVELDLSLQVLGFWMWWLFIIPSLRARKPSNEEKEALNIAFLASPILSLIMPTFTKDVTIIWWGNAIALLASYGYAYLKPKNEIEIVTSAEVTSDSMTEEKGDDDSQSLPKILLQAFKALDYGSGQERGARK